MHTRLRGDSLGATVLKKGMDDATPWLGQAVERLRRVLDPELILLFGSRARGSATRKSDLDLMLVMRTDLPALARIERVLRLLADSPWPVEAIVYTPEELQRMAHTPFVRRVLKEGRVLYERRAA